MNKKNGYEATAYIKTLNVFGHIMICLLQARGFKWEADLNVLKRSYSPILF